MKNNVLLLVLCNRYQLLFSLKIYYKKNGGMQQKSRENTEIKIPPDATRHIYRHRNYAQLKLTSFSYNNLKMAQEYFQPNAKFQEKTNCY